MNKIIIPKRISKGANLRVIAPSCSGKTMKPERLKAAEKNLTEAGFKISYGKNVFKMNEFQTSDVKSRLADLHSAFSDPKVDGILAVRGGFNANDLLDYIDRKIIKNNPKMYCGYSDNTALQNAIFSQTGLVTFSGPNFSTFGHDKGYKYTFDNFINAVSENYKNPFKNKNKIKIVNKGKSEGTIIGGNLCTFNLLQGTKYMPDLTNKILFIEDDHVSNLDQWEFMRNLQSVINLPDFKKVKAIVFGVFEKESNLSPKILEKIVALKPELKNIPVLANVSFGHVLPITTFPIGGKVKIDTSKKNIIEIGLR